MQTVKQNVVKKINLKKAKDVALPVLLFLAGLCSPLSVYQDFSLPVISLILVQCVDLSVNLLIMAAGSLITLGALSIFDTYFLPYFVVMAVYIIAMGALKNRKWATGIAGAMFIASKLLMVYSNYLWQYKALIVVEVLLLTVCPLAMVKGWDYISVKKPLLVFEDYCNTFIWLFIACLSFTGIGGWLLYGGVAVALAVSLYYVHQNQIVTSLLSALVMLTLLMDKGNFVVTFGVFMVLYTLGAWACKGKWWQIYLAVLGFGGIFTFAFIKYFNSFNIIVTAAAALIVYFALTKSLKTLKPQAASNELTNEKDYHRLLFSVKRLDKALRFLGNTAVDISKLTEKNNKEESLEDMVANEVCKNCPSCTYCWQEKYSQTQEQFSKYANKMYWAGGAKFDFWFCNQCKKLTTIEKSFEENSRLLLSRRYIKQSQQNSQKMLQTAFLAIAHTVGDIADQSKTARQVNTAYTMQMDNFLVDLKIQTSYCLCTQNPDKFMVASFDDLSSQALYKIKLKLESLYNQSFEEPKIEYHAQETLYVFCACAMLEYDFKWESAAFQEVCGDECECFEVLDKVYLLLSDGMGTGVAAAAESKTALSMAKSLLSAQVDINNVVEIVNLALNLKSGGESGASLDILCVDLYTGNATITKAGAGESLVVHSQGLNRFYKDTLPLGILKDVKSATYEFKLNHNDTVILMSDGVQIVTGQLKALYNHDCQSIVSTIIKTGKNSDDRTVAALQVKLRQ